MSACRRCGHPKDSHVYGEGPCRPGFLCDCQEYDAPEPRRVRLLRTKGARLPAGTANVARPTKWGNPFRVGDDVIVPISGTYVKITPPLAVALFEAELLERPDLFPDIETLRGRDLACWCPPEQPCHADVLLRMANR